MQDLKKVEAIDMAGVSIKSWASAEAGEYDASSMGMDGAASAFGPWQTAKNSLLIRVSGAANLWDNYVRMAEPAVKHMNGK